MAPQVKLYCVTSRRLDPRERVCKPLNRVSAMAVLLTDCLSTQEAAFVFLFPHNLVIPLLEFSFSFNFSFLLV